MNTSIRRLALRNAAKVAFGSFVMGCGGTIATTTQPDAEVDAKVKPDASILDVVSPPQDAALACTGPTDVDASNTTEETFQCCVSSVSNDVGDASLWSDPGGPDAAVVTNDPAAANCCSAIIARIDNEPDGGSLSDDYGVASQNSILQWCCYALGNPIGPACTPWGPPTPPAMGVA